MVKNPQRKKKRLKKSQKVLNHQFQKDLLKKKKQKDYIQETEGKIREGGLRKNLKVDKDYKFTKTALAKLLKNEVGKKFTFQDKSFMMTEKLRKQIQLGLNMIKN